MTFPTDITHEEAERGFHLITFKGEYSNIFGEPEDIEAVALPLDESDYLFKVDYPAKGYKHMRWGHRKSDLRKRLEWHPIGDGIYPSLHITSGERVFTTGDFTTIVGVPFLEPKKNPIVKKVFAPKEKDAPKKKKQNKS